MSSYFHGYETRFSRVRKPQHCECCSGRIDAGEPAQSQSGMFDGSFYRTYFHPECWAANREWCDLFRLWGEDWVWLHDEWYVDEPLLHDWLWRKHPLALYRLSPKRYAKFEDARSAA